MPSTSFNVKKNQHLLILLLIFLGLYGNSQPCLEDGYHAQSQSDIDQFLVDYPDCNEIEGDLRIFGYGFENLFAFNNITHIHGDLYIETNTLINFSGLDNLEYVGGSVLISDNEQLIELEGLNNLENIANNLTIEGNHSLVNLDGLESLQSIGGQFYLGDYNIISGSLISIDGLSQLNSIGEGLNIMGCGLLSNLDGLENLESLGKHLSIAGNPLLEDISALQGIDSINGYLLITQTGLTTLSGLENVKYSEIVHITFNEFLSDITLNSLNYVNGDVKIYGNKNLFDLDGLLELDSIGKSINTPDSTYGGLVLGSEYSENNISSLNGLSSLKKINGYLTIRNLDSLINLDGLEELETVTKGIIIRGNMNLQSLNSISNVINLESLVIMENSSLENIDGVSNVNPFSLYYLKIYANPLLSNCNVFSICGYLLTQNGESIIASNGVGCNSVTELHESCDIGPCMIDYIEFTSQEEIDEFLENTAFCNEIEGDILIHGEDITNLEGLSVISQIGGSLIIQSNPILTDISGLINIDSIGGDLIIEDNTILSTIHGLDSITAINGSLQLIGNDLLSSVLPLLNLNYINGDLRIEENQSLLSIKGLRYINAFEINNLYINNNTNLSLCDYQNICDYLSDPIGVISISNNASGCSNLEELEAACEYGYCLVEGIEFTTQGSISNFTQFYPNCDVIEGDVSFQNNSSSQLSAITNLDSLHSIVKIEGNVNFGSNYDGLDSLNSFSGLTSLVEIGGDLTISSDLVTNLNGLENLTTVQSIKLYENNSLQTIDGLESINSLEGDLIIGYIFSGAPLLNSLQGLSNLTSIEGDLIIRNTESLSNLEGLNNLDFVNGSIHIVSNENISDISALSQLNADSIENLTIYQNPLLSACNIDPICDYISSLSQNTFINIFDNSENCNDFDEVMTSCGACYLGGVVFSSQDEIDAFPGITDNCSIIWGDLIIEGYSITNVDSLIDIIEISGDLIIENNSQLDNLNGLSNLTSINGNSLSIVNNNSLASLTGIGNIVDEQFEFLEISDNINLSNCSVESVCMHFMNLGDQHINNNTGDCLNEVEIVIACGLMGEDSPFQVYPNPSDGILNVTSFVNAPIDQITIYNQIGNSLYTSIDEISFLDISFLEAGLYIVEVISNGNFYQHVLIIS